VLKGWGSRKKQAKSSRKPKNYNETRNTIKKDGHRVKEFYSGSFRKGIAKKDGEYKGG